MAIPIDLQFEIDAPIGLVWTYFQDPPRVAPCLPGAELTRVLDEKTYEGQVRVQVGPVVAQYAGKLIIERLDPTAHVVEMVARGDQQGATGRAQARIRYQLRPLAESRTEIIVHAEVSIAGHLAKLGGGMIQAVARQLFRKFAECVERDILNMASQASLKD
ncbi:MAG: carbon monoxide dehydrogenase [Chloroflexi bacterium]|nr:SRPBCC family protein [Chloroflexota bacterium]TDI86351.1 MAG: carbon monoxide dehydrogenase [Chloroflexota bacterium]